MSSEIRRGLMIVEDDMELAEWTFRTLSAHAPDLKPYVAHDLTQARALLKTKDQDFWELALVDLNLGLEDGIELISEALSHCTGLTVLVVTSVDSPDKALAAIRAGAQGYLLKVTLSQELTGAVDQARQAGSPITPSIARKLLINFRASEEGHPKSNVLPSQLQDKLSGREKEVLKLIARGHSNKETGAILQISPATIDTHIRSIFRKLRINSRIELRRLLY